MKRVIHSTAKALCLVALVLAFSTSVLAQGFYERIQRGSSEPLSVAEFRELEKGARRDHLNPERYHRLAHVFADTSERVWALVYGEVFCLLGSNEHARHTMASALVTWYGLSFEGEGEEIKLAFYREARSRRGVPIEARYEQSAHYAVMPLILAEQVKPLTLAKLVKMRERQLMRWSLARYPDNALIRYQRRIMNAGHHEAYGYWLLGAALPAELEAWRTENSGAWAEWLAWLEDNPFRPDKPDFHRRRNGS